MNPRPKELFSKPCYPNLVALPEVPDYVVIGIASRFVESILNRAIEIGVKTTTIFASCYLDDDKCPNLPQRITKKPRRLKWQFYAAQSRDALLVRDRSVLNA